MTLTRSLGVLAALALLAACEREVRLDGERLDLRALTVAPPPVADAVNRSVAISLPSAVTNSEWARRNGAAAVGTGHLALGSSLSPVWSAPIGQGESRRHRIITDPVVAGGRIFTIDSRTTVTATSVDGQTLWQRDLTPSYARRDDASGGGLTVAGGQLYVTTGFGQLVVLDQATGGDIWSERFDAPLSGSAAVSGNRVYVVSNDGSGWALDTADGRQVWRVADVPSSTSMVGGPIPAVTARQVLLPFPSGNLVAVQRDNAIEAWRSAIAGSRAGQAYAGVSDITGDPIVAGNSVYTGNQAGRLMALDVNSGAQRWIANEAPYGPIWPVGNSLFLTTDRGELVRLNASNGDRIWGVELPYYTDARERRRSEIVAHYGPVVAGGRVIVASNDGLVRGFDPQSGALVEAFELRGGATANPVVANGTLYLVSTDGRLHAFR